MYYVYMLRCRDGSLYTGTAADLCRRMRQHAGGGSACARYTRAHPPRELAGVWRTERQRDALRLEYAVKQLARRKSWPSCSVRIRRRSWFPAGPCLSRCRG